MVAGAVWRKYGEWRGRESFGYFSRLEKDLGEFVLLVEEGSCRASQDKSSTYIFSSSSLFRCEDQLGGTRLVDVVTGGRRRLERRWPLVATERVLEKSWWSAPCPRKADVKSSINEAATSRAKDVSPLRKKPRILSVEKSQVGDVPQSSARVKHLVGADSKQIGDMSNIWDVPLKPPTDKLGDRDLLCKVVRARSSSPTMRQ
ncbi:hypothetical protein L3X38_013265 [Prunus dulcis]|uniref:Uncharacterized protein n=1 Tax=Prunus dulcis TaxID=3755 RepID=A0AAD4WLL6_PRUDU|nr:hypothetical protein L3X38_013265 [Prunus dulcis]